MTAGNTQEKAQTASKTPMVRINEILDKAAGYLPEEDQALIRKAYVFSAAAHAGQMRLSGEPYLMHPLEVANALTEMRMDGPAVAAGLLHDTVEDTKAQIEEIDAKFGEEVADIVDGVTKISLMTFNSREERQAENIRKMIMAMAEDIRVLLVKLADRLHNMRTLDFQKPHKQKLIAQETMDIYAPLANRLGLHLLKVELEDLSLKYLRPDVYEQLKEGVKNQRIAGEEYIAGVIDFVNGKLQENKIKGRVSGRTKHLNSTWNKMMQRGIPLEQVHDLIAFRIIVHTLKDCYAVLGLIHAEWKPVPGRFKDYISMPKANMYQSLHTTVVGPEAKRIEIQIRTEEMHRLAEFGVAAHWNYKESGSAKGAKSRDMERFSWLRGLMDWQKEESDSKEFMKSLRFDLFKEEVYVFTPDGEVKELPDGATPVDFAFHIHTQVGEHCAGARVNGRLVPLSTKLKNGDTVEIITDPSRRPSRDWLKFVKTAKARTRVNHFIRTEERDRSISLGKDLLEKEGRKAGINFAKALKDGELEAVAVDFSLKGVEDLLSAVGYTRITAKQVINRLLPKEEKPEPKDQDALQTTPQPKTAPSDKVGILGVDDVLVRFANCCNPLPGDPIKGYISRGKGVTVHTADCPNIAQMEPERLINVSWEGEHTHPYPAKIKIICRNERGVLALIAGELAERGVNIDAGTFRSDIGGTTELIFTVEVRDSVHLYDVINRLSHLSHVIEVIRLTVEGDEEITEATSALQ